MPARPSVTVSGQARSGAGEVLSRRALNRALLARQLLLARVERPAMATIEHPHADRARVVSEEHRTRLAAGERYGAATFLVDGFVAGAWKIESTKTAATLMLDPLEPLAAQDRAAVVEEGTRLLAFAAPDAETAQVRFR